MQVAYRLVSIVGDVTLIHKSMHYDYYICICHAYVYKTRHSIILYQVTMAINFQFRFQLCPGYSQTTGFIPQYGFLLFQYGYTLKSHGVTDVMFLYIPVRTGLEYVFVVIQNNDHYNYRFLTMA